MQYQMSYFISLVILMHASQLSAVEESGTLWPNFQKSPWFDEQTSYLQVEPEVRLIIVAPRKQRIVSDHPNRVILFATPNGNTIEQTLGCRQKKGRDWHYDIQHIAAQYRQQQSMNPRENLILVCLEANGLSWPRWRAKHPDNPKLIRKIIDQIRKTIPLKNPKLTLACHSGGGSFLWGFLNGSDVIPAEVDRFIFLDANYSFNVDHHHGDKLLKWIKGDQNRRLIILSYDDRNVLYRGKKVVSSTGGTFRATYRMRDRFKQDLKIKETKQGAFIVCSALNEQIKMLIHTNLKNQILHTRLVGEMNGYLYSATRGTPEEVHMKLPGSPRVYDKWIQPEPFESAKTKLK